VVNKVILVGRLGQDPIKRSTATGMSVCNFSVATDDVFYKKDGTKQSNTEWHRIVTWDKLADNCGEFLKKGSMVYLEGKIQTSKWEKDGIERESKEINAQLVKFLPTGTSPGAGDPAVATPDDDVPF